MNNALNFYEDGLSLSVIELNKQVIVKALPARMAVDYIKQRGKNFTTKEEIKKLLNTLEEAEDLYQRVTDKKNKKIKNWKELKRYEINTKTNSKIKK